MLIPCINSSKLSKLFQKKKLSKKLFFLSFENINELKEEFKLNTFLRNLELKVIKIEKDNYFWRILSLKLQKPSIDYPRGFEIFFKKWDIFHMGGRTS